MEYQEGEIAEDGNGNFLVFRGGDWYPAQSDGRPLERIPRPDYGAGHYQLPNGDIVRQGPRGGQETVENFGGAGGGAGGSGLVSADQRGRYNIGASPLVRAEKNLAKEEANGNPLNRDWGAVLLNSIDLDPRGDSSFRPFAPLANVVGGQDYQNAQQALSTYEASLMPIQSGASVTASEAARQIRADFPALGDSEETLRRKAANRMDRINAILSGIGKPPAFSPENIANPDSRSTEDEIAALGAAAPAAGEGPKPGDVRVTQQPLAPTDSPNSLSAQGYKYDAARDVWSRSSQVPVDPEAVEDRAAAERTAQGEGLVRKIDAFAGGALDTLTFGAGDEIAAGINAVIPMERGARTIWNSSAGEAFRNNHALITGRNQADARDVPVSRGAGQVAGAFAPGMQLAGAGKVGALAARPIARNALAGAGYGSVYGFASDNGDFASRSQNAMLGTATGIVGGAVAAPAANAMLSVARPLARPIVNALGDRAPMAARDFVRRQTPNSPRRAAVDLLEESGVSLTPGQRAGGLGQTVENLAQRAPILGPAIRGARERGVESLNRAAGNRALDAIGEGVPAQVNVGGDLVSHVQSRLGAEFDRAYAMVPEVPIDDPALIEGMTRIAQRKTDLPLAMQDQFDSIVSQRLERLAGSSSGEKVGAIRSELNTLAGGYLRSPDKAQQDLGSMIAEMGDELDGAVSRASPEAGAILGRAREGYSDYIRLERASTAAGGRPFSPGQLESAVRASDGSVRRGAVGRGDARMQDLSSAARTIMPDAFGNPGTADAAGLGALGVGAITEPVTTAAVAAGLGAASVPYRLMGRKVVERLPNAHRALRGMSDDQLDVLVAAASDPATQADAIAMLTPLTTNRREARNLARAIRHQAVRLTTAPQSNQQR